PIVSLQLSQYFIKTQKLNSEKIRDQVIRSFECLYYSSSIKDNREQIISLIDSLCVHITLISLSHYNNQNEQEVNGLIQSTNVLTNSLDANEDISIGNSAYLDYMILVDALFVVLCNDDSEYWSLVQRTILIIIETSEIVSNTKSSLAQSQMAADDACVGSNLANLAMFDYLAEKLSQLCYERSWYAKKAGCLVLKLLTSKMPLQWTLQQCFVFMKSIFNVLVSVTGEISSGAINVAKDVLNNLVEVCFVKLDLISPNDKTNTNIMITQLNELQQKTLNDVLKELVKQIVSSSQYVRHESTDLITKISELQSKSIYNLLQPFQEILLETVGPRKHLKLRHYSHQFQIGILESLEFCSSAQPQLLTIQLSNQDHQNLYNEIISICEQEDSSLSKLACYKSLTDLTPIRKAALNCLASFYHLLDQREQILNILHKSLESPLKQIQQVSFNCLKNYNKNSENYATQMSQSQTLPSNENHRQIIQIAADYLREYLHPLTEYIYMKKDVVQHLSYITKLYPTILNDKFTEYLLSHLKRWLEDTFQIFKENLENQSQTITKPCNNEIELCSSIISLLAELQSAPAKLVESSIALVLKYEKIFGLEASEKFRRPLSEFLKRFPFETLKYLLHNDRIKDMYCFRFILYLIKRQTAQFCQIFKTESNRLVQMLNESQTFLTNGLNQQNMDLINKSNQILYLTVFVIYRLIKIEANSL
ncbi:Transformation transcription domain-associated, partial [Brachionus plicatilis]